MAENQQDHERDDAHPRALSEDDQNLIADFERLVNMTPKQLEQWLATDESKTAGQSDSGPSGPGSTLRTAQAPEGVPGEIAEPRPEEFSPGLDPALLELVQATAEIELAEADEPIRYGPAS
ncbi:DUF3140 domain-containing protein [Saccharopolyspora sp. NFXS83]|uniref:DUF3140 domain-containing protein n=1 Tax=Saccharopolyspora sp. NFXS83 TaxID=2993560 RepID=UPI00224A5FA9|nr:DUF3140 domain-containing protein [Saccharopolyspora sp. NFXS83]MCX2729260.1 DUF3140 domain-containing protein [Saccharopolyspora sp. NFXS83]